MQMDRDPGSGARGSAAAKTKGKRSKLSQRRRDDDAGAGGLPSPRFGGDGAHANGDDANVNPGSAHPGSFFAAGDPLGHEFGDAMQQGSPTLLSALKGSSLRAAYGADFAGAFKEDNMSLLGDFKNAAARFSIHPPGGLDGLSAEGDLQSDALWSSFPSDVDALFPSRVDMQLAAEMYGCGRPRRRRRRVGRRGRRRRRRGEPREQPRGLARERGGRVPAGKPAGERAAAVHLRRVRGRADGDGRGRRRRGQRRAPLDVAGLVLRHVRGRAVQAERARRRGPRGHARDARARLDGAGPAGREPARRPAGASRRGTSSAAARSGGRSRRSRRT
jgi:hypothetical protein